ncbi:MAG: hypothetical protein JKY56_27285 [Kofleriaceae bacterium]|nr:hypothetical protein [Kofleriaceae bacterium]
MTRIGPALLAIALVGGMHSDASADGTLGLMVDAGLPDGVVASLVVRPTPRIRAHGGVSYNGFAPGVRAGVSLAAFPFWITPTITVEAGRYFQGNANPLVEMLSGSSGIDEPILRDVGYDYANAHVGLEFGYSGMTFYVHAGMSVVELELHNVGDSLALFFDDEGPAVEVRSDPLIRIIAPSGRTGFVYYF